MNLTTAFDIFQKVWIKEISQAASIIQFKFDGLSILYNVEYWYNGKIESVWLYERELKEYVANEGRKKQ